MVGGGAALAPHRAGPQKRGFTGDRTQYSPLSPEPRGVARAASRGWAGRGGLQEAVGVGTHTRCGVPNASTGRWGSGGLRVGDPPSLGS